MLAGEPAPVPENTATVVSDGEGHLFLGSYWQTGFWNLSLQSPRPGLLRPCNGGGLCWISTERVP